MSKGARCAVIVGPQGAGKTTLLRALIERAGRGAPALDASQESQDFGSTTEPNLTRCAYLGDDWAFIDCPGSVELLQASFDAMAAADIVILVADPDPDRAAALSPFFKFLDERQIPHVLFVNRVDETRVRVRALLQALQTYSDRPLVLRQVPIRDKDRIVGAIDLVSERAWKYREGAPSELIEIPETEKPVESEAREAMLDTLADFDDGLLEQILEDKIPPSDTLFKLMAKELEEDAFAPVLMGSAAHGNGVTRLFKLLRHEAPEPAKTAERLGFSGPGETITSVIRTMHLPHVGKISVARVWKGAIRDGDSVNGGRVSGLLALNGEAREKRVEARAGDIVGLPRLDALASGDLLIDGRIHKGDAAVAALAPVYALAIRPRNERDDVRLSTAVAKLIEEDASLSTERRADTGEFVLRGQGDMHLRLAAAKLKNRYGVEIETTLPRPSYRETIRATADHHARHKKQTGGHGQFADIKVKIKPLPRGAGVAFDETIHGGAVPKQFIPAVEAGVREGLQCGPLGFPVVDVAVTLYDGQHHSVDSNEMSFKLAGRQAMRDALPDCQPVLLEPIYHTVIHSPRDHTSKAHAVISSRRGQILGFDARPGWPGWDSVTAMMPESGLHDLIIELRSLTQGAATFEAKFDHYQELYGKDADKIVEERRQALTR
ncbi:elongation factor G [Amphiplicatus metriothermophilus]|uniref:Elongation factor G n=1 Tax=Amphiplicatus metriothermophilus TaxID=1519374 RepID=A0A239Q0X2_9PROT|nr:elongation factor G [Amphiplicatus metriothermophilus]MBB5520186.1 elongation factor G [Amphiplicatus metriothermophilus]SNT75903.1 translation elongation factor 2 (EF-2/EF-G) [Amphiplicatus metriothermophilus]